MRRDQAARLAPVMGAKVLDFSARAKARRDAAPALAGAEDGATDGQGEDAAEEGIRAIAVASGKGGVGKTNVVANLAYALQKRGKQVIVMDADLGLANIDTLLGLHPRATLRHVLQGECDIADVLLDGPGGIRIVPSASGFEDMTQLTTAQRLQLLDQVDLLDGSFDVLLIDVGAGISTNVMFFAVAAQETMVVVTPEPTSLTDAYALIKVLSTRYAEQSFNVLVNMARNEREARRTFAHLAKVAERFLQVGLRYAGHIPWDDELPEAVRRQRTVFDLAPAAPVTRAFGRLADRLLAEPPATRPKGGLQFFFRRLLAEDRR
jgi:flagellar biosynthesis protein FlhG